jgi:hypothetical protein
MWRVQVIRTAKIALFKLLSKFIVANTRTQKKTPSHIGWPEVFSVAS